MITTASLMTYVMVLGFGGMSYLYGRLKGYETAEKHQEEASKVVELLPVKSDRKWK